MDRLETKNIVDEMNKYPYNILLPDSSYIKYRIYY